MVIEDECNINDLIVEIPTAEGYHVDSAQVGDLGLKKLLNNDYDLILCDMRMPGMYGRFVYKKAKQVKPCIADRFIFLTGDIMSEETRTFLKGIDNFYIMKPFNNDQIMGAIAEAWQKVSPETSYQLFIN